MIADRVRKLFVYEKIEAAGKNEKSIITHHKIINKFINCSVEKTVDTAQKVTTIKQTPFKLDITWQYLCMRHSLTVSVFFLFCYFISVPAKGQEVCSRLLQSVLKETLHTKYIPLTNRVRGPYRKLRTEFFPRFMARALRAWAINRSVTYSTVRENEVSKIFIISLVCVWGAQERFLFTRNSFKFLKYLESKTSQFEIVFKSLARFNT